VRYFESELVKPISRPEKRNLQLLFLLFGLGIMAIAPRNPEIKHNLGVTIGNFGTLLSLGGIGSLISLMFGGHIVHRFGPRPILVISSSAMYGALSIVPHLHHAWIFLFLNIFIGSSFSLYHIASNGQALKRQTETNSVLIPKLHGLWSTGALGSAILAFAITSHISLAWHIDVMMIVIWSSTQIVIWNLRDHFFEGTSSDDSESSISFQSLIAAFKFERVITFGLLFALMIEFATTDWATIFTREQIGMSAAVSILPYLIFMLSMILVRFSIHRLLEIRSEQYWLRIGPLVGGSGFVIFIIIGTWISHNHKWLGFSVVLLSFSFAGLGCSHLAPTFFGIAGRSSSLPGSVVIAQLGLVNTILVFLIKIMLSWVAQATSVMVALLIPGIMLILVSTVARLGRSEVLTRALPVR
jgi:MFS family permease